MYYLIIAIQAYSVYHVLKTKNEINWIFLIVFIPVLGSLIYLYMNVYNKQDVVHIQKNITSIINPTKKVLDLKKELAFADTFQNKIDLADAYLEIKDYKNAIVIYKKAKSTLFSNDAYLTSQLMEAYFYNEDYENVITCYKELVAGKDKIKAHNQVQYGLAFAKLKKPNNAEKALRKVNINFSNYEERFILAEFLIDRNKKEEAKEILEAITEESNHFTPTNKKKYKHTVIAVKALLKTV